MPEETATFGVYPLLNHSFIKWAASTISQIPVSLISGQLFQQHVSTTWKKTSSKEPEKKHPFQILDSLDSTLLGIRATGMGPVKLGLEGVC